MTESTNDTPHALTPAAIKAAVLEKVKDLPVPETVIETIKTAVAEKVKDLPAEDRRIAKDIEKIKNLSVAEKMVKAHIDLFNQARAGILHMLAVRKTRELQYDVSHPVQSAKRDPNAPDRDMHEYKLLHRLLASTIEDYIIDADPQLSHLDKNRFVMNPYGMTHYSEEKLKPFFGARNEIKQLEKTLEEKNNLEPAEREKIAAKITLKKERVMTLSAHMEPYIAVIEQAIEDLRRNHFIGESKEHWDTRKAQQMIVDAAGQEVDYTGYSITDYGVDLVRAALAEKIKDTESTSTISTEDAHAFVRMLKRQNHGGGKKPHVWRA